MQTLALILALLDVALATVVFVVWARPDYAIGVTLRSLGLVDPWFLEEVGAQELGRLRKLMRLIGVLGLVAVFACSFVSGAVLALVGLAPPG